MTGLFTPFTQTSGTYQTAGGTPGGGSSQGVAYNPDDPFQAKFLSALARGETGSGGAGAQYTGVGGSDLHGAPTDAYGFPQWGGYGNSHAAGPYQFQPGTWDSYASQYGLNFNNLSDQNAAAWYLAQDTYRQKTGGDLQTALQNGDLSSVQSALKDVWPSVTGNGASPGLAAAFGKGGLLDLFNGNPFSADTSSGGGNGGGILGAIENWFVRFGLIAIGALIVLVALWKLLSDQGVVPSPGDVAKTAAKVVAVA